MKPSNNALGRTLGRVARKLDFAYPSNPCPRRGKRLTMVGVVGVVLCFKQCKKSTIPTWDFYKVIVFGSAGTDLQSF